MIPGGKKKKRGQDSVDHKASAHVATTTTQTDLSRGATFGVDWGVVTPRVSRRCASVEPVSPRHVTSSQLGRPNASHVPRATTLWICSRGSKVLWLQSTTLQSAVLWSPANTTRPFSGTWLAHCKCSVCLCRCVRTYLVRQLQLQLLQLVTRIICRMYPLYILNASVIGSATAAGIHRYRHG